MERLTKDVQAPGHSDPNKEIPMDLPHPLHQPHIVCGVMLRWGLEPHMLLVKSHLMMALGIKAPIVEETSLMQVGACVCPRLNCSSQGDPEFPQGAFPNPAR